MQSEKTPVKQAPHKNELIQKLSAYYETAEFSFKSKINDLFKKEAFILFEGLLAKIKNDLIKFLFNLNVVISDDKEEKEITDEKKLNKKGKKKRW